MFVNYLAIPIDGLEPGDGLPADYESALQNHKDLILAQLEQNAQSPTIWSKYEWAGAYHNFFCANFIGSDKHLVSPEKLSQPPRALQQVYARKGRYVYRGDEVVGKFKDMSEFKVQRGPTDEN